MPPLLSSARRLAPACVAALLVTACAGRAIERVEDTTPPIVRIVTPAAGARVDTRTPVIDVAYTDERSGIAAVTFRALINGEDRSAEFDHYRDRAKGQVSATRPLPLGENHLVVEVADRAGNVGRAEVTFFNAGGGWLGVEIPPTAQPRRSVELVLDASGSMRDAVRDSTRMEVAKGAVTSLAEILPREIPMGLRVFFGCDDIRSVIPVGPVDRARFAEEVAEVHPAGGTPLVASLLESLEALGRAGEGARLVMLVTDGGESCGGSISEAIDRAREAATRVIVVGIDIPAGIVEQLRTLAEGTGGVFVPVEATDPARVRQALEDSVLRIEYQVLDGDGEVVARGDVNGDRLELPIGTYMVELAMLPTVSVRGVRVEPLAETTVEFRRASDGRLVGAVQEAASRR